MAADGSRLFAQAQARAPAASGWRRPLVPALLVAAWLATLGNGPLWVALRDLGALDGPQGWRLAAGLGVAIAAALVVLMGLLAWRWTFKPWAIALLMAAAAAAHYMNAYRVVIDPTMMVNVFQTDARETADLITGRLLITLALLGVLPSLVVARWPIVWAPWPRRFLANLAWVLLGLAVVVAAVLASFQPLSSTMRNHKQVRYLINPLNSVYAVGHVASEPLRRRDTRLRTVGADAQFSPPPGARPPLIVLVLGETARAANFGLNGYARDTTPQLAKAGVLSFRRATSCGTSTAASVPCMFSPLGREGYADREAPYETLLDVLQRAGLAVFWLDNQSGCKGVCDRVPNAQAQQPPPPGLCNGGECLDEALLHGLDARLAGLDAGRRARGTVLVLHMMGSHGPAYHKRSPPAFKRFMPECTQANLQACSREQVVNAYDNTILYTDHVLARTLEWLKARSADHDTAFVYLSDHGESLGENGLYLHGLPYALAPEYQIHIPWLTWLSPGFQARQGLSPACLAQRADEPVSHDHLFYSMLALAEVRTAAYKPQLDAYAACRKPKAGASVPAAPAVAGAPVTAAADAAAAR